MNKNHLTLLFVGLIFIALILSNLYFFKKTLDLNAEINRMFELEATINKLKIEHQNELADLKNQHQDEINKINLTYEEKFETVKKALNAFEYEIEEFYKNKHILKEDYLENKRKIEEVRNELGDD